MGGGLRIFDITEPGAADGGRRATRIPAGRTTSRSGATSRSSASTRSRSTPKTSACLAQKGGERRRRHRPAVLRRRDGTFTTASSGASPTSPGRRRPQLDDPPERRVARDDQPARDGSIDIVDLRTGRRGTRLPLRPERQPRRARRAPAAAVTFTCMSNGRAGNLEPARPPLLEGRQDDVHGRRRQRHRDRRREQRAQREDAPSSASPRTRRSTPSTTRTTSRSPTSRTSRADGKLLVVTDERGGGLTQTSCNEDPNGIIGGAHFWAIAPIAGSACDGERVAREPGEASGSGSTRTRACSSIRSSPCSPAIGRAERACTIHVFRIGGNGSLVARRGLSGLRRRVAPARSASSSPPTTAPASGGSTSRARRARSDGIAEDGRSTWGNTRGWNVMPGAETWSAKEYKGYIYAGDMGRGFDVYSFTSCDGLGAASSARRTRPAGSRRRQARRSSPSSRSCAARRPAARPTFGMNVASTSARPPDRSLTFTDKALKRKVTVDGDRLAHDRRARRPRSRAGRPWTACRASVHRRGRGPRRARRRTRSASSSGTATRRRAAQGQHSGLELLTRTGPRHSSGSCHVCSPALRTSVLTPR